MTSGNIYLIVERDAIGGSIHKIGMTRRPLNKRVAQYPKGSLVLLSLWTRDAHQLEKMLIKRFDQQFTRCPHIGREYYDGDPYLMQKAIYEVFLRFEFNIPGVTQQVYIDTINEYTPQPAPEVIDLTQDANNYSDLEARLQALKC